MISRPDFVNRIQEVPKLGDCRDDLKGGKGGGGIYKFSFEGDPQNSPTTRSNYKKTKFSRKDYGSSSRMSIAQEDGVPVV